MEHKLEIKKEDIEIKSGSIYKLSSRTELEVKKLTVAEINTLSEKDDAELLQAVYQYVSLSIIKVVNSSYKGGGFKVEECTGADFVDLMVILRLINFKKSPYLFEQHCIRKTCKFGGMPFVRELSLEDILNERTFLSAEGVKMLQEGNKRIDDSSVGKITWHMVIAKDEEKLNDLIKQYGSGMHVPLMVAIDEIAGVEKNDLNSFLKKLDGDTMFELAAIIDQFDCGFLGKVGVTCPECKQKWSIKLPFSIQALIPSMDLRKEHAKLLKEYKNYPSVKIYK